MRSLTVKEWIEAGEVPMTKVSEMPVIWKWRQHKLIIYEDENVTPYTEATIANSFEVANPFKIPVPIPLDELTETEMMNLMNTVIRSKR